jgi:hypothetical protein
MTAQVTEPVCLVKTPSAYKMAKHIEIDTYGLCQLSDGS